MIKKVLFVSALGIGLCLFLFIAIYFDAYYIEPNWIEVRRVTFVHKELAEALSGLTIVQISDLDMKEPGIREKRLVKIISHLKPDVLLFTGDLVDSWIYFEKAIGVFSQLKKHTRFFYAVSGNDDYANIKDMDLLEKRLREIGIVFLRNQAVKVSPKNNNQYVWIVFLDRKTGFEEAVKEVDNKWPALFLSHYPENIYKVADFGGKLLLAGNTQGGQVGIRFLRNLSDYASSKLGEFIAGLYRVQDAYVYVSRGIGASDRNIRFFCRPEVTVFSFRETGRQTQAQNPEYKKEKSLPLRLVSAVARKIGVKQSIRKLYDWIMGF